jgi:acyl-coenzyme A thioesterase PaaI-like protein
VIEEAVFLLQAFQIAHGAVMALDKDSAAGCADYASGGERARAQGLNLYRLA